MTKVVLYLENCNPDAGFHYGRKEGGDLTFLYNRDKARHEATFTIEEWRADNFRLAKTLLDQPLTVPVFFDIQENSAAALAAVATESVKGTQETALDSASAVEPEAASSGSDAPPASAARKQRKSKLTPEQKAAAQKEYEEQSAVPSFIPT